jgi:hypothetical protein
MRIHRTAGGRPALGLLVAVLVLLLSAAACTGDDPDADGPGDPTSSWSPTGTMDPSSTGSGEPVDPVEPELPEVAREASEEGARAFIAYYWELINYAQATGDVKALKAVSGTTCTGCAKGIAAVSELYEPGGHAEGGAYELSIKHVKVINSEDKALRGVEARYDVRNAEQVIVRGDGTRETIAPATTTYLSYLIWIDDAWRTDVLEPR